MNDIQILIVDDSKDYALELEDSLAGLGYVEKAYCEEDFRRTFAPYKYDLIFLDLHLKEGKEGLDLLDHIIEEDPSSVVIVISGYGDIATAVEALQKGAKTFLEKGKISLSEIRLRAEHAIKQSAAERRIRQLEASQEIDEIVGDDPKIKKIRDLIHLVAQDGETTVLIRGETGTGKELIAKAIYRLGARKRGPFVAVALTDNPDTITSALFGHEKGAFTGASERHHGYFEQAHKGILFMDEIGDLPPDLQIRILRVIDSKSFRRMGGREDIRVDTQVVTATNRPLEEMIKDGRFRKDLYYRLKVFEIYLPPLRERQMDIPLLAEYFLHQLRKKGRTPAKSFSDDTVKLMLNYSWPGNVRQLRAAIESSALSCKLEGSSKIRKKYFQPLILDQNDVYADTDTDTDIFRNLAEIEIKLVDEALKKSGGKKTEAWKLLKYPNRFSMLRRIKRIMTEYPELADKFPVLKKSYIS